MELLNPAFVILVIKVAISILPGVFGIYLIATGEDSKRAIRSWVCNKLFGVSNAFEYKKFVRFLAIVGIGCFFFSAAASWFLVISPFLG